MGLFMTDFNCFQCANEVSKKKEVLLPVPPAPPSTGRLKMGTPTVSLTVVCRARRRGLTA